MYVYALLHTYDDRYRRRSGNREIPKYATENRSSLRGRFKTKKQGKHSTRAIW